MGLASVEDSEHVVAESGTWVEEMLMLLLRVLMDDSVGERRRRMALAGKCRCSGKRLLRPLVTAVTVLDDTAAVKSPVGSASFILAS
jgi:hypothetical protein